MKKHCYVQQNVVCSRLVDLSHYVKMPMRLLSLESRANKTHSISHSIRYELFTANNAVISHIATLFPYF